MRLAVPQCGKPWLTGQGPLENSEASPPTRGVASLEKITRRADEASLTALHVGKPPSRTRSSLQCSHNSAGGNSSRLSLFTIQERYVLWPVLRSRVNDS
jgi:hypothetical protein